MMGPDPGVNPDPLVDRGREFDRFIGRLLIAVTYVAVNLIVDVSYGYLDPRVRPS